LGLNSPASHWPDITDLKEKAGILRHLQLSFAWAENSLARNTDESVRQAERYYREAARLLGSCPRKSRCRVMSDAGTIQNPAQSIIKPNLNHKHVKPALLGLWDTLEAGLANVHFRRFAKSKTLVQLKMVVALRSHAWLC
jgi:hypothetical protein